jgi:hypothetical protein
LTAEKIVAEDAEAVRLAALRKANSGKPDNQVTVFELAESGQTIEFQAEFKDTTMAFRDLPIGLDC